MTVLLLVLVVQTQANCNGSDSLIFSVTVSEINLNMQNLLCFNLYYLSTA